MGDRRLSEEEAAAVFRRAAELDDALAPGERGLDRVAVERAALDVGLAAESVQQALAELDAGRLAAGLAAPAQRRWRWRGQVATVERALPTDPATTRRHLDGFLAAQTLRVARRQGEVTLWEPSPSLGSRILRRTDLAGRIRLADATAVSVCVTALVGGSFVRVDIGLHRARARRRRRAIAGTAIGGALGVVGIAGIAAGVEVASLAVAAGAGAAGATAATARSSYEQVVTAAVNAVELALDDLSSPPSR